MPMTPARTPHWQRRAVDRSVGAVQLRSADRAQRVVAAVRALAGERGSAEFTMAEVAEAAGVPLRSLYRQFPGRDELLLALLEDEARLGADILSEHVSGSGGAEEQLRAFVLGLWEFMISGSGYASVLVREHLRLAERHPAETRAALEPLVGVLVRLLAGRGTDSASDPHSDNDALVLFSVLLAHMHALLLFHSSSDLPAAGEGVWQVFRSIADTRIPGGNRSSKEVAR